MANRGRPKKLVNTEVSVDDRNEKVVSKKSNSVISSLSINDFVKGMVKSINRDYAEDKDSLVASVLTSAKIHHMPFISTGSIGLDVAIGIGGVPRGRIVEFYGPESGGKTTMALSVIAQAQKAYPEDATVFIDAEHSLDPEWAKSMGINLDLMPIIQPRYGEEGLSIVEDVCKTGRVSVVVIDSVAALIPKAEWEGTMEDQQMGAQARMMSKAMRKLGGVAKEKNVTLVFINQIREKIGVMFGSNETTPGGRALKFYASVRIEVRRGKFIENAVKDKIGVEVTIKVVKNKVGPPHRIAEFDLIYGKGINRASEILVIGEKYKLLTKEGNTFYYDNGNGAEPIGGSKAKALAFLNENIAIADKLTEEIMKVLNGSHDGSDIVIEDDIDEVEDEEIDEDVENIEEDDE